MSRQGQLVCFLIFFHKIKNEVSLSKTWACFDPNSTAQKPKIDGPRVTFVFHASTYNCQDKIESKVDRSVTRLRFLEKYTSAHSSWPIFVIESYPSVRDT